MEFLYPEAAKLETNVYLVLDLYSDVTGDGPLDSADRRESLVFSFVLSSLPLPEADSRSDEVRIAYPVRIRGYYLVNTRWAKQGYPSTFAQVVHRSAYLISRVSANFDYFLEE